MPLEDFFEAFCVMDWRSVSDGGGGFVWEWTDGFPFDGHAVLNTTTQMQIAQQTGTKAIYTLVTARELPFEKDDRVKRIRDGAIFKITADPGDRKTPAFSSINAAEVTMERVTA